MNKKHLSFSDEEMEVLRSALEDYSIRQHAEANLTHGQIISGVRDVQMKPMVHRYRKRAEIADDIVARIKAGFDGLTPVA